MATRRLVGIENVGSVIDSVFSNGKSVWIVCSDENEQEVAFQIAINKIKELPNYGCHVVDVVKSSTGLIHKKRYTMFPALYISYVNRLTLNLLRKEKYELTSNNYGGS